MGLSPQCLLSLLVDGGLGRKQGRSDGGTVTNERIKQCRRTYDDEVERGDVGKLRANKLHSGQFASLASLYGMTGLTSGKFLWPKEKSWVLYRTKQAVIGLSFSPGKLPRASFPGREESTERLVNPYGNADKEKETEAAGPDRQRKPSTKCNLQRQRSKMHENELPANYGRYRRFTSRIHREHGIATPLINNKAIAWLQAASPRSVEPAASPSPPPGQDGTSCKIRILPSSQPALRQNFSLGFQWDHALDFNPRSSLGVSSFSWLVDLLLSLFHLLPLFCLMKDILAKALYISKKGDFNGSDGSLTGVPENVIDKWAFETRFVATRAKASISSQLSSYCFELSLLWESVGHLFLFEFHLLFGFWYRFQFLCSNQYLLCQASLPGCPVLFNPLFFCLRQRRISYTVYGRAGFLAGTSSISAYCLFGVGCSPLYGLALLSLLCSGRPVVFLPYKNAYYIVLEASPAASKTRFVDKARSVLDLR
ncbi:hypothetical protein V6N12_076047 [Hibiscus sabdariffa]|uniref:Uncharacterized protein n=1 Tax=Hibiscus sabdariffa TaxID=183260 RepID=A0ABR2AY52_9ROSI